MEIGPLLRAHVDRCTSAVESGSFEELVAHFTAGAVMTFEGVPVGPFHGREAIAAAYAARPPDDRLIVLEVLGRTADSIDVSYAWSIVPDTRAGTMTVERLGEEISRLVVRFE